MYSTLDGAELAAAAATSTPPRNETGDLDSTHVRVTSGGDEIPSTSKETPLRDGSRKRQTRGAPNLCFAAFFPICYEGRKVLSKRGYLTRSSRRLFREFSVDQRSTSSRKVLSRGSSGTIIDPKASISTAVKAAAHGDARSVAQSLNSGGDINAKCKTGARSPSSVSTELVGCFTTSTDASSGRSTQTTPRLPSMRRASSDCEGSEVSSTRSSLARASRRLFRENSVDQRSSSTRSVRSRGSSESIINPKASISTAVKAAVDGDARSVAQFLNSGGDSNAKCKTGARSPSSVSTNLVECFTTSTDASGGRSTQTTPRLPSMRRASSDYEGSEVSYMRGSLARPSRRLFRENSVDQRSSSTRSGSSRGSSGSVVNPKASISTAAKAAADGDARSVAQLLNSGGDINAKCKTGARSPSSVSTNSVGCLITTSADASGGRSTRITPRLPSMRRASSDCEGSEVSSTRSSLARASRRLFRDNSVDQRSSSTRSGSSRGSSGSVINPKASVSAAVKAAGDGDARSVVQFLNSGVDINAKCKTAASTLLSRAAAKGHLKIVKLLLDRGAAVNTPGRGGLTPLHEAASCGKVEVCRLLLGGGAAVAARDRSKCSPLHYAGASVEVTKLLLEFGADPNAQDKNGQRPDAMAVNHGARGLLRDARCTVREDAVGDNASRATQAELRHLRASLRVARAAASEEKRRRRNLEDSFDSRLEEAVAKAIAVVASMSLDSMPESEEEEERGVVTRTKRGEDVDGDGEDQISKSAGGNAWGAEVGAMEPDPGVGDADLLEPVRAVPSAWGGKRKDGGKFGDADGDANGGGADDGDADGGDDGSDAEDKEEGQDGKRFVEQRTDKLLEATAGTLLPRPTTLRRCYSVGATPPGQAAGSPAWVSTKGYGGEGSKPDSGCSSCSGGNAEEGEGRLLTFKGAVAGGLVEDAVPSAVKDLAEEILAALEVDGEDDFHRHQVEYDDDDDDDDDVVFFDLESSKDVGHSAHACVWEGLAAGIKVELEEEKARVFDLTTENRRLRRKKAADRTEQCACQKEQNHREQLEQQQQQQQGSWQQWWGQLWWGQQWWGQGQQEDVEISLHERVGMRETETEPEGGILERMFRRIPRVAHPYWED